jgi:hypothetical protein
MAKTQTEKCPFPSKYSPGKWITPAQYLVEVVCERRAINLQTTLPAHFWELSLWKTFFQYQLRIVNKLLKTYSYDIILFALNDAQWQHVWSFGNKKFCNCLQHIEPINKIPSVVPIIQKQESNSQSFTNKKWQKLKKTLS